MFSGQHQNNKRGWHEDAGQGEKVILENRGRTPLPEQIKERGGPVDESDPEDEYAFSVTGANPLISNPLVTGANPLDNEYILEHMLKYIISQPGRQGISKDFQNIRLVSNLWKDVANRLHKKSPRTPTVVFAGSVKTSESRAFTQLRNFLKTMKKSTMIPVQSFTFVLNKFYYNPSRWKVLKEFLLLCGPTAISLKFIVSYVGEVEEEQSWDWCTKQEIDLPLLKTLEVVYGHCSRKTSRSSTSARMCPSALFIADFTGLLLSGARNLREFQFKVIPLGLNDFGVSERQELALLQYFGEKIFPRIPRTVTILKLLGMDIPDSILAGLIQLELKLEEFSALALTGSEASRNFLESQVETLKTLNVFRFGGFGGFNPTDAENLATKESQTYITSFQLKLKDKWRVGDRSEV